MAKFYVIEYTDITTQNPNFDHVVISEEPERTNMSNEVRTDGWCGTTNGTCVHARGEYDSIEAARTFIKAHYTEGVREVDDFYTNGDTIIAKFLLGRYETLDSEATAAFVYDELMERIGADSSDDEIRTFADDMERAANAEINATLTRVEEMAITHRANLQSEA